MATPIVLSFEIICLHGMRLASSASISPSHKRFLRSDYFRTLKMASRLRPKFIIRSSVPTKTRFLPVTVANLQPLPRVILFPFFAFRPLIVIPAAMFAPPLNCSIQHRHDLMQDALPPTKSAFRNGRIPVSGRSFEHIQHASRVFTPV